MADCPADITAMSFEEALAELDRIVHQLEEGQGKLDDAIDAYTRGVQLRSHCEKKLSEAQARIDKILVKPDGQVTVQTTDIV